MEHILEHTLRQFFEGKTTPWENRQIVAHFLRGCDSCAALAAKVWSPAVSEQAYDEVLDRAERRFVARFCAIRLPAFQGSSASPW